MSPRFYRNPMGRGFAGGLPCQVPSEGDQPFASSPSAHPIPQGRRRASGDLFSGSPGTLLALVLFPLSRSLSAWSAPAEQRRRWERAIFPGARPS